MRKVFNNPLVALSNIGLIDGDRVVFDEPAKDVFMTGSMKYTPYIQLSCVSYRNVLHGCVALHGTDRDEERVNEMYALMDEDIAAMNAILSAPKVQAESVVAESTVIAPAQAEQSVPAPVQAESAVPAQA
jgi:hypothetical protein